MLRICVTVGLGRALTQAVGRRLSTEAARIRARFKSCGMYGGQSGTGAGFLPVLRFPLPLIHCTNCSTTITIYPPEEVQWASKCVQE
jgi:hypothetical protein